MSITQIIQNTLATFPCSKHGQESKAWRINCGDCEDFAIIVVDKIHDAQMTHTENYEDGVHYTGHAWITIHGKHYDAECSIGVDNWRDLPIFTAQRRVK